MAKQIHYLGLEGLKVLYGVVDDKITTAVNNAKGELKGGANADYDTLGKLEGKIKNEVTRATGVETELSGKIGAMDLAKVGGTGKFVQSVSQSDGKVSAEAADLNAAAVAATAIEGSGSTVAVAGATVAEQIQSLGQTLKTVEGNAAKYKVVQLTPDEVTALGDANVKEAYKVVSYVGADAEGTHYTAVGAPIKIYKDGNLKSATLGDNQELILTYTQADGSDATVKVDFAAIAFNTEFKNGLQVAKNGEISVQVDTASEKFLTVGEGGVKLAGVQAAIDAAVVKLDVQAKANADKIAGMSVNEDNQTVTIDSKSLQFIAFTAQEIQDAANK